MKHVEFAHGMVMETTYYAVMYCSNTKVKWDGYKVEKRKMRNMWCMLEEKMIEIIFLT